MRTLFLGDSHTHGYWRESVGQITIPHIWDNNNYAEIYSDLTQKQSVIYAMSGTTIQRYPDWLKFSLDKYSDIDEVFVQSLHWNRFMLSGSETRDYTDELSIDYFTQFCGENSLVSRYSDIPDEVAERTGVSRDHNFLPQKISLEDYESLKYIPKNWKPDLQHTPYVVVKLWAELMTHLQHREYCRTLFLMDRMCHERNIKMYLWRVNDRVYIPNNIGIYGDLKATKVINESAETYLKRIGYDISNMLMPDKEHYNLHGHLEIAHKFIPYCNGINILDT
jgi:hypothetical protein